MATSTIGAIAGSIFIVLSIVWWIIQKTDDKKKLYRKAKEDAQKAIDSGDTSALLDAERRMQIYR